MIIGEPLADSVASSPTLEQGIIQECTESVRFVEHNPIMVTNHPKYEGATGIYVGFYPSQVYPHYVMLLDKCPGKFLWLIYEQLIKLGPMKKVSDDEQKEVI